MTRALLAAGAALILVPGAMRAVRPGNTRAAEGQAEAARRRRRADPDPRSAKKLLVLNGAGKQVASLALDAQSAWLDGAGHVSVPAATTLTTYDLAGKVVETCKLKAGATVQDVENGYAVYFAGAGVHLLTIATNADRVVARVKGLVQADLEPGGLYYGYNAPTAKTKPGRVTFVPR